MDASKTKAVLRAGIEARMARLNDRARTSESRSICKQLRQLLPKAPAAICAYYPLQGEVDIRPLLHEILTLGHTLFLPCYEKPRLIFRRAEALETLVPGVLGIREPPTASSTLNDEIVALALIPGKAFDDRGTRLGRGNGGYDIWLEQEQRTGRIKRLIGVAFECQIVPEVPHESHDMPMDDVCTARGLLSVLHASKTPEKNLL